MSEAEPGADPPGLRVSLPRLVAEFFVIVIGVLVALGVDSWVSWRNDRALEQEYLERLLDDVRYDLGELADVAGNSRSGAAYVDSLSDAGFRASLTPARLAGALTIAASVRVPDLSRGTFNELLASGRIGLLRSGTVRAALAEYDRTIAELMGFWDRVDFDEFHGWVYRRLPRVAEDQFYAACGDPLRRAPAMACEFEVDDWDAARVVSELGTDEATMMLTYERWVHGGTIDVAGLLLAAALDLEATLAGEIAD